MTLEFELTGFADELTDQAVLKKGWQAGGNRLEVIKSDLETQINAFKEFEIPAIELRNVGGVNVAELADEEALYIAEELKSNGFKISALGSPDGKIDIQDDLDSHYKQFKRIVQLAGIFQEARVFPEKYIRIFSYYNNGKPQLSQVKHMNIAIAELGKRVRYARQHMVTLLHENESGIYGTTPERCKELLDGVNPPYLKAIFDPANFVHHMAATREKVDILKAVKVLEHSIVYVHNKDWVIKEDKAVIPGKGDGKIFDLLLFLSKKKNGTMYLSMEPHLGEARASSGVTPKELYKEAVDATKAIIKRVCEYAPCRG